MTESGSPVQEALTEAASPLKFPFAPGKIIRKFMIMWLAFIGILIGVALLVDIDWAKPYCQTALTQMFHRKVRIGHLTWSFGLNGLEVDTTKLAVFESNGAPFMVAGNCEIGIGFLPLLNKRLVISHLNFENPEIWAIRQGQATWNFNDLLEFGPDIRYFQVQNGKLHLIDRIPNKAEAWKAVDLNEVKLKFVWPHKGKKTPFYLAFRLPKKGYTTSFDLSGLGSGELQNWQENKYNFKATVSRANPDDMMPFLRAISDRPLDTTEGGRKFEQLQGLFDFKIEGGGILSKGITADVSAEAQKFSFDAPVIGVIKAPEATTTAKVRIDMKNLEWKDMVTRLANVELTSHGTVSDWSKKLPQYSADFDSYLKDLGDMSKLVTKTGAQTNSYVDPKNLGGEAEVQVKVYGPSNNPKMITDVKSEGLPVEEFVTRLPKQLTPALCLLGLSKTSHVKGEIKLIPDERVDVIHGVIPVAGGTIETEGSANLKTDEGKFTFHTHNLSLALADKNLYESKPAMTELKKLVFLPPKQRLNLEGSLDINGVFAKLINGGHNTGGTADFKNAEFSLSDGSLSAKHMNGHLRWDNDLVNIEKLAGTIGDGTFVLSGTASVSGTPSVHLKIESDHLELNQLNTLLKVLKVNIPLLTEHQLRGRVHHLALTISGPRTAPKLYFRTTPEDLCYQPVGMKKPLRATSGTITYDRDTLTLQEVGFVTHNDKVTTTFAIEQLSSHAKVSDTIKLKSSGIDLSDVDFYLSSTVMPKPLKKLYTDFLKEYQLSKVHGRVYGDATCAMKNDKPNLNGVISLVNVGAKAAQKFPVEHISGTLAASGRRLTLQDISGTLRNSRFNLNGQVDDYQTATPGWSTQLIASIDSKELLELIPSLTDQFKKWKLTITSTGPLALRAKVDGNMKENDVTFSVSSPATNRLAISALLGQLHQPLDEALKIDGALKVNSDGIKVSSAQVLIGDSLLEADGSMGWTYKDSAKTDLDLRHCALVGKIRSPHPVPARRLISLLEPTIGKEVEGTVDGALNLTGTAFQPKLNGKIILSKIGVPKFDVKDLSGSINLEELSGADQKAEVDVSQVQIGQLPIHAMKADIRLDADEQQVREPKIHISNGRAKLAGGALEINGLLDMNVHKLTLRTTLSKAEANKLTEQLFGHPGELSGTVDADVKFETQGTDYKDALANLKGDGTVTVHSGIVTRFSQLQTKITQANLLHQGLFGFNLNNLLQSAVPVRTGRFKDMVSEFRLAKNIIYVDELTYNGDDMRLWGAGKANLNHNTLDVEIAGKIPRVTSSVFGSGTLGEVSKAMTIQKLMNKVTLHQLENLPSLPVLGDFASDKPRAFSFKINSPLDKPKSVGQSIEKTFHWLPSKPRASAHPLPAITNQG